MTKSKIASFPRGFSYFGPEASKCAPRVGSQSRKLRLVGTDKLNGVAPAYKVHEIVPEQFDAAYLLASSVIPMLDRKAWTSACWNTLSNGSDGIGQEKVSVAINPLGYIQGLCVSVIHEELWSERRLDVPVFLATSVADEAGVAAEMIAYLRRLAAHAGCSNLRIWTIGNDTLQDHVDGRVEAWEQGFIVRLPTEATSVIDPPRLH